MPTASRTPGSGWSSWACEVMRPLYELSPEGGHVLGIDLGARRLTVALADIAGRVLAEVDEPTDSRGGAWAIDQIAQLSDRLARDNHTHPSRIRSIVLATPGVVNPKSGAIEMAPNIAGLGHLNVVGLLGEKLGSPVVLENDINLALLGEIWHGCAQSMDNVAFLALGSGVGAISMVMGASPILRASSWSNSRRHPSPRP